MKIEHEIYNILPLLLLKILISTVCGFIIGYDREIRNKAAGLRTNILICTGCAIFTYISFWLQSSNTSLDHIDPSRIIGQIITGIGFLGAGVIIKNRDNIVVGVTTASFIWTMSDIGVLIGCGMIITPIVLSIILVIISRLFEIIERKIKNNEEN